MINNKMTTKKLIEINGEKKTMMGHILKAVLDPNDKFECTKIIKRENDKFIEKGDLTNLSEDDLELISKGLYTYCPFITLTKTRLSKEQYDEVGAIIIGENNEDLCEQLHFAYMNNMMKK
jgi:hypothetical protein